MKRAFTLMETVVLVASIGLVSLIGAKAHRWMWTQTELWGYRMAMQEVAGTLRQMRYRAIHARRTIALRIHPATRRLVLVAVEPSATGGESVERTLWLPRGLEVTEAPEELMVPPTGILPVETILVEAPAFQRTFRLLTSPDGIVQLHEEPST
jgi:hypothetical protein